jgi:hypothetical protein
MSNKQVFSNPKIIRGLFLAVLVLALFLRFYQHFMGRSLWEDEAHIALNFIYFGFKDLTKPLVNYQTAPIFFLFSVEGFSRVLGHGEVALRSFPFLISIISLPLFYFFVRDLTKNSLAALISFFVFGVNCSLIYYASEIKPYILDVSVYVTMGYLLFSRHRFVEKNRFLLIGLLGSLAILYSNASAVVLLCCGIFLLANWVFPNRYLLRHEATAKNYLLVFASWAVVFAVNYYTMIHNHPYGDGMKQIWAFTFPTTDVTSPDFNNFVKMRVEDTFFSELLFFTDKYYFPYVLAILFAIAVVHAFVTRKFSILLFTIVPVLIHFVLAMNKMYPFFYRFILYLLPCFIILSSLGVAIVAGFIAKRVHPIAAVPVVVLCCYFMVEKSLEKFPMWDREFKPALTFINENYPGTKLFVTTPETLYTYYDRVGKAKNKNYERIEWNLSPEQYYEWVRKQTTNYILLYSTEGYDGYGRVIEDLKNTNRIVRKFEHGTYGIMELKP